MDLMAFATLAGPVLGAAVPFFYRLVNSAANRSDATVKDDELGFVERYDGPVSPDPESLTPGAVTKLERISGALEVYRIRPDIIQPGDAHLAQTLADACTELSQVYRLNFRVPSLRAEVNIKQDFQHVEGTVRGVRAASVTQDASVEVQQKSTRVYREGAVIGLEVDGTIG